MEFQRSLQSDQVSWDGLGRGSCGLMDEVELCPVKPAVPHLCLLLTGHLSAQCLSSSRLTCTRWCLSLRYTRAIVVLMIDQFVGVCCPLNEIGKKMKTEKWRHFFVLTRKCGTFLKIEMFYKYPLHRRCSVNGEQILFSFIFRKPPDMMLVLCNKISMRSFKQIWYLEQERFLPKHTHTHFLTGFNVIKHTLF